MSLLDVRDLEAGYGSSRVLLGVDLALEDGQTTALFGRNGMGKTTLVRTLFGLTQRHRGSVHFAGESITGLAADAIARRGIALVPEGRQVFGNLSVRENLAAFARARAGATDAWSLDRVLDLFPRLGARLRHLGTELSGGEQQMLAIGRALMTNPRLLILDEATEGLAPLVRGDIWNCLARLKSAGQTILIIDKHIERLAELADHNAIIERGRVVWRGASRELLADRSLWTRYLGV